MPTGIPQIDVEFLNVPEEGGNATVRDPIDQVIFPTPEAYIPDREVSGFGDNVVDPLTRLYPRAPALNLTDPRYEQNTRDIVISPEARKMELDAERKGSAASLRENINLPQGFTPIDPSRIPLNDEVQQNESEQQLRLLQQKMQGITPREVPAPGPGNRIAEATGPYESLPENVRKQIEEQYPNLTKLERGRGAITGQHSMLDYWARKAKAHFFPEELEELGIDPEATDWEQTHKGRFEDLPPRTLPMLKFEGKQGPAMNLGGAPEGFELIRPGEADNKLPEGFQIIDPKSPGLGRLGINPFSSAGSGPSQWGPEKTLNFFKDQITGLFHAMETVMGAGDIESRIKAAEKLEIDPSELGLFSGKEAEAGAGLSTAVAMGNYSQAGRFVSPNEGLSLFGGIKARGKQGLDLAKEFEANGSPMEAIRKVTGWEKRHGDWRFELNDAEATWRRGKEFNGHYGLYALEDVMMHPDLFKFYPQARKIAVAATDMEGASMQIMPDGLPILRIDRHMMGTPAGRKMMLHELQHYLQFIENFPVGANPATDGWLAYRLSAGEAEARAVSARADLTPMERMKRDPQLDEKVPRAVQDVRREPGVFRSITEDQFTDNVAQLKKLETNELLPMLEIRARQGEAAVSHKLSQEGNIANSNLADKGLQRPVDSDYMIALSLLHKQYRTVQHWVKELQRMPNDDIARPHFRSGLDASLENLANLEARVKTEELRMEAEGKFLTRDQPQMTGQELRDQPSDMRMLGSGGTRPKGANDNFRPPANQNHPLEDWVRNTPEGQIPSSPYQDALIDQAWNNAIKNLGEPEKTALEKWKERMEANKDNMQPQKPQEPQAGNKSRREILADYLDRNGYPETARILNDIQGAGAFPQRRIEVLKTLEDSKTGLSLTEIADKVKGTEIPPILKYLEDNRFVIKDAEGKYHIAQEQISPQQQTRGGAFTGGGVISDYIGRRIVSLRKEGKTIQEIKDSIDSYRRQMNMDKISYGTVQRRIHEWEQTREYIDWARRNRDRGLPDEVTARRTPDPYVKKETVITPRSIRQNQVMEHVSQIIEKGGEFPRTVDIANSLGLVRQEVDQVLQRLRIKGFLERERQGNKFIGPYRINPNKKYKKEE